MISSTNHKPLSYRQLLIILISLGTLLPFTSCECDPIIEPGPPQKTIPSTPQLNIAALTYEPSTNYITCTIENKEKQPVAGKLILQITPKQGTDATIQGATWKDGKYEIELKEAIPIADSPLTKDFKVQWGTALTNEFTFQPIYVKKEKVPTPVGSPALVSCNRTILLVLKDLKYDPSANNITCIIENQGKGDMDGIVVHWQAETPGVQITKSGSGIQEMAIGSVGGEVSQPVNNLGQLNFGENTSAQFTFWLTRGNDTTHYSKQSIAFQAPVPINLQLVAVGPTTLETEVNKVFKARIIISEADKGSMYPAHIRIHIKKHPDNSPAKILYNSQEVTSLLADFNDVWGEIDLEVDPEGQERMEFSVQLTYAGQDKGEVRFSWYKDASSAMFKALKEKNLEVLKEFLNKEDSKNLINKIDPDTGHTLLTQAIESLEDYEGKDFINILLQKGADVNLRNGTGVNPLHTAITHDRKQMADRLLKVNSINIGTITTSGNTPLHLAAQHGRRETMESLLLKLSTNVDLEHPRQTILDAKNKDGKTALQLALEKNHDTVAKQLLEAKADKSIITGDMSGELKKKISELLKPIKS